MPISRPYSTTPTRPIATTVGAIIAAPISSDGRHEWPRNSIQASIGTVIEPPM